MITLEQIKKDVRKYYLQSISQIPDAIWKKNILNLVITECERFKKDPEKIINKMVKDLDVCLKYSIDTKLINERDFLLSYLPKKLTMSEIENYLWDFEGLRYANNYGAAIGMAIKYMENQGAVADGKDIIKVVKLIRNEE